MIPFLECESTISFCFVLCLTRGHRKTAIGIYKPNDVRTVLEKYHGKDIPIEYAKTEAEGKRQFLEEWRKTGQSLSGSSFTLSSLFGGSVRLISFESPAVYQ